jgi:hypothetical protein
VQCAIGYLQERGLHPVSDPDQVPDPDPVPVPDLVPYPDPNLIIRFFLRIYTGEDPKPKPDYLLSRIRAPDPDHKNITGIKKAVRIVFIALHCIFIL